MHQDIMLDIETMSTRGNAAIVAIGAVRFDPWGVDTIETLRAGPTFYTAVRLDAQTEVYGRHVDPDTVRWWSTQSEEARARLLHQPLHFDDAMILYNKFADGASRVWGYGAAFDNAIVEDALKSMALKSSVSYRGQFCMRTICGMAKANRMMDGRLVAHYALDDAIHQCLQLQDSLAELNIGRPE